MQGAVFEWKDTETDAEGWVLVRSIVNGLSASGSILFDASLSLAVLERSTDYFSSMSVVLSPQMGCTVAGIRFPPSDDRRAQVLRRFLVAHVVLLRSFWIITNYRSPTIKAVLDELHIGNLLEDHWRAKFPLVSVPSSEVAARLEEGGTTVETLVDVAGGDAMCQAIKTVMSLAFIKEKPRIMVQGYSKEAQAFLYLLEKKDMATVVGMADDAGFIHSSSGIDVGDVLASCSVQDQPRFFGQLTAEQRQAMNGVAAGRDLEAFFRSEQCEIVCLSAPLTEGLVKVLLRTTWAEVPAQRRFLFFIGVSHRMPASDLFVCIPNWVTNCGEEQLRRTLITLEKHHATSPVLARQILEDSSASICHFIRSAHLQARKDILALGQACILLAQQRKHFPLAFGTLQEGRKMLERTQLVDILEEKLLTLFDSIAAPKDDSILEHIVHDILQQSLLPRALASAYLEPVNDGAPASKGVLLRVLRGIATFLGVYRESRTAANSDQAKTMVELIKRRPGLSFGDQREILKRFLAHQHLPLAPASVELAINQALLGHKYIAVALSKIIESSTAKKGEATESASSQVESEKTATSSQMATEFGMVLTDISSELLKLGKTSAITQFLGRTVMYFGGNQLGAMLESQLSQPSNIRNDIALVEFLTTVVRANASDDFSVKFFAQLPDMLIKMLPSSVPKESTRNIAEALIDIIKKPDVIMELLYFYILPQFCEGTIFFDNK